VKLSKVFPELASLGKFPRIFLKRLLDIYPNWHHYAYVEKERDLIVKVPAPGDREALFLWIIVYEREQITVGFGGGHVDLEDWHNDLGPKAIIVQALEIIAEILQGKQLGITLSNGGGALARREALESAPWVKDVVKVDIW
jgi:hypothetical protein